VIANKPSSFNLCDRTADRTGHGNVPISVRSMGIRKTHYFSSLSIFLIFHKFSLSLLLKTWCQFSRRNPGIVMLHPRALWADKLVHWKLWIDSSRPMHFKTIIFGMLFKYIKQHYSSYLSQAYCSRLRYCFLFPSEITWTCTFFGTWAFKAKSHNMRNYFKETKT